jgi:hypothetical protein
MKNQLVPPRLVTLCAIASFFLATTLPASAAAIVFNVSSLAPNGTYTIGNSIAITVGFTQPVTVTGTPSLALNSGGTAFYASGSGSSSLVFNYTVGAGEQSGHLDYTSSNALALNGGTIKDSTSANAVLTLPMPGATGSLGANTNIVIIQPPTVTNVTSTTPNGVYNTGNVLVIVISFSQPVSVTGMPSLALNSGGTASYSSGSGTSSLTFTYTVGAGQQSSDLDYSSTSALSLNGGTIQSSAGSSNAILTLPPPGAAGSLGANKNLVIGDVITVRLVSFALDSNRKPTLVCAGIQGDTYQVQTRDTLINSNWTNAGPPLVAGAGGLFTYTETSTPLPAVRFYRAMFSP